VKVLKSRALLLFLKIKKPVPPNLGFSFKLFKLKNIEIKFYFQSEIIQAWKMFLFLFFKVSLWMKPFFPISMDQFIEEIGIIMINRGVWFWRKDIHSLNEFSIFRGLKFEIYPFSFATNLLIPAFLSSISVLSILANWIESKPKRTGKRGFQDSNKFLFQKDNCSFSKIKFHERLRKTLKEKEESLKACYEVNEKLFCSD